MLEISCQFCYWRNRIYGCWLKTFFSYAIANTDYKVLCHTGLEDYSWELLVDWKQWLTRKLYLPSLTCSFFYNEISRNSLTWPKEQIWGSKQIVGHCFSSGERKKWTSYINFIVQSSWDIKMQPPNLIYW